MRFRRTIAAAILGIVAAGVTSLPFIAAQSQIPVGNFRQYPINITPAATAAAIATVEQTFTVTGLTTADVVFLNTVAAPTSLCPAVGARASAANTVSIQFSVLTAAACTPVAGIYNLIAVR